MSGNARETIVFVGKNLLGDCLCTTPVVAAARARHPDAGIVYIAHDAPHCRLLEGNPAIDLVLYSDALVESASTIPESEWIRRLPIQTADRYRVHRLSVHAVHRLGADVFTSHLSHGFARLAGLPIDSVRPVVRLSTEERAAARAIAGADPYIVFGMHSTSLVIGPGWTTVTKDWVFAQWLRLAKELSRRSRVQVFAVGAARDSMVPSRYWRNLYGLPIKVVAALLEDARCTITVESGLAHLAHAVDGPMVVIYSNDVPRDWAWPLEARRCRVLYDSPRLITSDDVLRAMDALPEPDRRQAII